MILKLNLDDRGTKHFCNFILIPLLKWVLVQPNKIHKFKIEIQNKVFVKP